LVEAVLRKPLGKNGVAEISCLICCGNGFLFSDRFGNPSCRRRWAWKGRPGRTAGRPGGNQEVILDLLTEPAEELEICDRENLRYCSGWPGGRDSLPSEPCPGPAAIVLAAWQGLTRPGRQLEDLQGILDQLFGFPATAEAWEKHILPARCLPIPGLAGQPDPVRSGPVVRLRPKKGKLGLPSDLELFLDRGRRMVGSKAGERPAGNQEITRLLPGKSDALVSRIYAARQIGQPDVTDRLWTWPGRARQQ